MIMTAELNSHQRISYYEGVKLIRHHHHHNHNQHHQNGAHNTNTGSNNSNNSNGNNNGSGGATSNGGGYFHHPPPSHHPPHFPPPPHHHQHHPQQPPPLPPHHPGHFHLPCPTGPPHLQHPAGVLHLNGHHGPPPHPGQHHYGPGGGPGGGSNQTTRLYTGSPLIRSTGHHHPTTVSGTGNHKKSYKHHNNNHRGHHNNHNKHHKNNNSNNNNHNNKQSQQQHQNNIIIGGSCSSGSGSSASSSSSSSNEHLNNLQSPNGSPIVPAKLDISPLTLSSTSTSSSHHRGECSSTSSSTSSPGLVGSPSPSSLSNVSSSPLSGSPRSTDANKDLDHFYFLEEHWKPSSDDGGTPRVGNPNMGDLMDTNPSSPGAHWLSSTSSGGSPSPPAGTTMTMMVDQFFANVQANNFGPLDGNHNFNGNNLNGPGPTRALMRDSNNNLVTGEVDLNESAVNRHQRDPDPFRNGFNGGLIIGGDNDNFNINGNGTDKDIGGKSGFIDFGENSQTFYGTSGRSEATTMVNVETQIGTFNGQRDLEIRLCFIKGDRTNHKNGATFGSFHQQQQSTLLLANQGENVNATNVIEDPFSNSNNENSSNGRLIVGPPEIQQDRTGEARLGESLQQVKASPLSDSKEIPQFI